MPDTDTDTDTDTAAATDTAVSRVRLWDLPVRLCHWGFVILIAALWWTAENNEMGWHMRCGIALLALIVFRILWGFVGSSTARFSSFLRGPSAVFAYLRSLRDARAPSLGHNPAGGWSVIAMLAAMALQVTLGLFAGDPYDGATGPLNRLVRTMTADIATDLHEVFFNVLLLLLGLHIAAVVFYLAVKRDNLVGPMITGSRAVPNAVSGGARAMEPVAAWRAIACLALALAFAAWIWSGAPPL